MKPIEHFTLAQLRELGALRPDLALTARRLTVCSYDEFVNVLYEDIDECIKAMEDEASLRAEDGEDRLTSDIINWLKARTYNAAHDEYVNGHSDIVVRHPSGYLWLGEAKVHGGYDHLVQGFQQLCTRYSRGTPNADKGGLVLYVRNVDCASVVAAWLTRLQQMQLPDFWTEGCPTRKELGFYSSHTHESSGRAYKVRHMAIVLHCDPKDKKS